MLLKMADSPRPHSGRSGSWPIFVPTHPCSLGDVQGFAQFPHRICICRLISRPSNVRCLLNSQWFVRNSHNWRRVFLVHYVQGLYLLLSQFPRRLFACLIPGQFSVSVYLLSASFCRGSCGIDGLQIYRRVPVPDAWASILKYRYLYIYTC